MTRSLLLVLAALLLGGCRKPQDGEPIGSPGGSVAGTEAKRDDRSPSPRPPDTRDAKPATSLIAVATTSASEAQPCERVCGSLGDCLFADDAYTTTAAGGLELQCLDLCVHSADSAPAKSEFLACGAQTECGQLQACAERSWTALAAARQGPAVEGVLAPDADTCKLGCRWLFSCLYSSAPPGEAPFDPALEQPVTDCVNQCDQMSGTDHDYFRDLHGCLVHRCSSPDGVYQCIEEAMAHQGH